MDTVPGNKRSEVNQDTQKSTISRYSCRIVVDRDPPHTARVFAAGFDKSSNIFLGVSVPNNVLRFSFWYFNSLSLGAHFSYSW